MTSERALRFLILAECVLAILTLAGEPALEPSLPAALRAWLAVHRSAATGAGETLLTALWLGVVAATVVAWVGLLCMLRAARPLYLGAWLGYLALLLLRGPVISTSTGYVLQLLMTLAGGAVLGTIYFSDLSTRLRRFSDLAPTATGQTGDHG